MTDYLHTGRNRLIEEWLSGRDSEYIMNVIKECWLEAFD